MPVFWQIQDLHSWILPLGCQRLRARIGVLEPPGFLYSWWAPHGCLCICLWNPTLGHLEICAGRYCEQPGESLMKNRIWQAMAAQPALPARAVLCGGMPTKEVRSSSLVSIRVFSHQFILQFMFSFNTEHHVVNFLPHHLPVGSFSPLPTLGDAPAFVQHCCLLPRAWGRLHTGRWINDFFVIDLNLSQLEKSLTPPGFKCELFGWAHTAPTAKYSGVKQEGAGSGETARL